MQRLFAGLVTLTIMAGLPGSAAADDLQDCKQGDRNVRVPACTRIIAKGSDSNKGLATSYVNRGLAHRAAGDNDRAIADYTEALRLDASYALAYNSRGIAYGAKGDHDRAIADQSEALRLDPDYSFAYNSRGIAYAAKGDNDRAIGDYTQAIRVNPQFAIAYNNRGIAHANKNDNDRALSDYSEAIRLDPKYASAYYNRGLAARSKGDQDRAIADQTEAIKLDPKYANAYVARGNALKDKGELDRAIADQTEAIRLSPGYALAYSNRGIAHAAKGDNDAAIADYSEAIRSDPRYTSAYYNRGLAYRVKGDQDRAIADQNEAIRLDPKHANAYIVRGNSYKDKGDLDRAIADQSEAIRLNPTYALPYNNRGIAYAAKGDNARAIADYRKILELPAPSATDRQRQDIARERIARLTPAEQKQAPPPLSVRRVALVIGNANYSHAGLLTNPANDARAFAGALRRLGFTDVIERYDLTRETMGRALKEFGDRVEGAEWAVVFFAGHGIEMNGSTYLIPIDAELKRDSHVSDEALSLSAVQAKVDAATKLGLVILDACRNNPFLSRMARTGGTTRSVARGLPAIEPEGNVLVAYSAKHGTTADDGTGPHSPFTEALLAHIEEPGLEVTFLFRRIRDQVRTKTDRRQEPFLYGTLGSEPLYFKAASR